MQARFKIYHGFQLEYLKTTRFMFIKRDRVRLYSIRSILAFLDRGVANRGYFDCFLAFWLVIFLHLRSLVLLGLYFYKFVSSSCLKILEYLIISKDIFSILFLKFFFRTVLIRLTCSINQNIEKLKNKNTAKHTRR